MLRLDKMCFLVNSHGFYIPFKSALRRLFIIFDFVENNYTCYIILIIIKFIIHKYCKNMYYTYIFYNFFIIRRYYLCTLYPLHSLTNNNAYFILFIIRNYLCII